MFTITLFWFVVAIISVYVAGVLGYRFLGPMNWDDAMMDSALTLSGMGIPIPPKSTEGKIFASIFAVFNGIFLLVVFAALLLRILHFE